MLTLIAFLTAILLLVSLHEFGHYIVARWCGVKVVRFSVGFGKPFLRRKRGGTEWCLAPVPLGGYVKMVDTREGNVAPEDLPYAFDKQHPAKKIAIVAAGPLTNLLLAVLLYTASFSLGVTEIRPYVGTVEPAGVAAGAGFAVGDKIRSVNGKSVAEWGEAQTEIVMNLEAGRVEVAVETAAGQPAVRVIDIAGTPAAENVIKNQGFIGMSPYKITTVLAEVVEQGAAAKAGLRAGDKLVSVGGREIGDWREWVALLRESPGKKLNIGYERGGERLFADLRPNSVELPDGTLIGQAGIRPQADEIWAAQVRREYRPTVGEAVQMGWARMSNYAGMTVRFFGRLITGQASPRHISGPLTIADVAGQTAGLGLQAYLEFLALVSVSLGILNLLPVPVLDGGHLVYYTAEWLRGRPLSERVQAAGMRIGMMLMLMLMFLAFFNDITRLFG
ncbi:RIP metalloprotease RseP [Neisseria leonii]|uniref:Zinc metalloprotease n=1 Tax=Neisseria leonii TaxID=2995413 RepID=A0A9X4E3F7_9NEIS|nr:RIP metalloprotease RseP [Neisseria sp. 51.81]MDD9328035.1 RIP metalloprotease RseP [Neisseria sp. 51.81]